jgi:hypothetical protein
MLDFFVPDDLFAAFLFTQFAAHDPRPSSNWVPEASTDILPISEFAQMLVINLLKSEHSKSCSPLCADPEVQHRATLPSVLKGTHAKHDHHIFADCFQR